MPAAPGWAELERSIVRCERCPRLRAHCTEVARVRRRAYRDETYWGKPIPGFGATECGNCHRACPTYAIPMRKADIVCGPIE